MPSVSQDLHQQIRRLRLTARRLIHTFGEGTFRTIFHGRGIEFASLREYVAGDDIRRIDWNTTARRGAPYVKTFVEERDLSVMLLLDLSSSMDIKAETVSRLVAIITSLADLHDDRIGCIGFTQKVEFYVPPTRKPMQPERILHLLLSQKQATRKTSISQALGFLRRVLKKHSILFLISDFLDRGFDRNLQALATKHEIVGLFVHDPIESALPDAAVLDCYDPESGQRLWLDAYDPKTRGSYENFFQQQKQGIFRMFARAKADLLILQSGPGADLQFIEFLRRRQASHQPLQLATTV